MTVTLATWNVNSIKARLPLVKEWLESFSPDIALLQELKCEESGFPGEELESLGYTYFMSGQKSYNGVAILSKSDIEDKVDAIPGEQSGQARYVEATTFGYRVASIYLPNGNPVDSEKFTYKLDWFDSLHARARTLFDSEQPVILGGDYNVIPEPYDCYDPKDWEDDALFQPASRQKFRKLLNLGYSDAFRALHSDHHVYSFWDYQRGAWANDQGIRIDHLLLSPHAADRLQDSGIDKSWRGKDKASDHTPVWCVLDAV